MSITDELREWMRTVITIDDYAWDIADHIDAEYQKAEDEWMAKNGQTWVRGYAECHAELMEGNEVIAADLEKAGWVCLPKDADGEPIHIDDVMDGYNKTIKVAELRYGHGGWVIISKDGNGYADPSAFAHHHEPTVEDVLRDVVTLCHNTWKEGSITGFYDVDDVMNSGNIAAYTKRIREAVKHDRD